MIKNDRHLFYELIRSFTTCFIHFVDNVNGNAQAWGSFGFSHQFLDQLHTFEDYPLASSGDVRKETMLNGVVLGAVGRIMGDAQFKPQLIGQKLEVLFENIMTRTITPTTVTED